MMEYNIHIVMWRKGTYKLVIQRNDIQFFFSNTPHGLKGSLEPHWLPEKKGLSTDFNILRMFSFAQALQYVQDNPDEVCPAGWKPGEKSMKPDPKLSKEYFAAI